MLTNFFGTTCVRAGCGHRNPKGADYCEKCGISLGFSRPAVLDGNRWSPAADEAAVYFKTNNLKGLFTKTLFVPAGMRAYVVQADQSEELGEGEHTTETLFARLNSFFQSPMGEVMIVRTDALPLTFSFKDLPSAELLDISAEVQLNVRIAQVAAFRRRFSLQDGAITTQTLADILAPQVRQVLAETLGPFGIKELAADTALRSKVQEALKDQLGVRLQDLGLQLMEVASLSLHHDQINAQKELTARLWLLRQEAQARAAHDKELGEMYDQQQWADIEKRTAELRRRARHAELSGQEADIAQTLRLRDLLQYKNILEAETKEQALRMGAADMVADLEAQYQARSTERARKADLSQLTQEDAAVAWRHQQALAKIQQDTALEALKVQAQQTRLIDAELFANSLQKLQLTAELERVALIGDATEQKALRDFNIELQFKNALRADQLAQAAHQAQLDAAEFETQLKRKRDNRLSDWDDAVLADRIKALELIAKEKADLSKLSGLEKLLAMELEIDREELRLELERKRADLALEIERAMATRLIDDQRLDAAHKRSLDDKAQAREDQRIANQHAIDNMSFVGSLDEAALISLAKDPAQIAELAKLAILKVHARMTPEQLKAMPGALAQTSTPTFATPTYFSAPASPAAAPEVAQISALDMLNAFREMTGQHAESTRISQDAAMDRIVKVAQMIENTAIGTANANAVAQSGRVMQPVAAPAMAAPPVQTVAAQPVAPAVYSRPAAPQAAHGLALMTCPACHESIPASSRFCSFCGASISR